MLNGGCGGIEDRIFALSVYFFNKKFTSPVVLRGISGEESEWVVNE